MIQAWVTTGVFDFGHFPQNLIIFPLLSTVMEKMKHPFDLPKSFDLVHLSTESYKLTSYTAKSIPAYGIIPNKFGTYPL